LPGKTRIRNANYSLTHSRCAATVEVTLALFILQHIRQQ